MKGEERGQGHEARKENIFSICEERVQSSSSDQVRGSEESGNLLLCSFKMEGRRKKMNKNESSPIQLGEGTSTLRQGFIQEGLCPSLDERKSHSSSACVMHFVLCTDEMYVQVCVCNINLKVCLSYTWSTQLHLSLAAREVAFFFPYFFIHSFTFLFTPTYQSQTT